MEREGLLEVEEPRPLHLSVVHIHNWLLDHLNLEYLDLLPLALPRMSFHEGELELQRLGANARFLEELARSCRSSGLAPSHVSTGKGVVPDVAVAHEQ